MQEGEMGEREIKEKEAGRHVKEGNGFVRERENSYKDKESW